MTGISGPDILIIGVQRAATSWLWRNLTEHPKIWSTPIKELHYFDRSSKYPSPSSLSRSPLARLLQKSVEGRNYRNTVVGMVGHHLKCRDLRSLSWDRRYFGKRANDDWYLSLFRPKNGMLSMEATPAYSLLDARDVEKITRLLPDVRVILILRNPVDRAWSQYRLTLRVGEIDGDPRKLRAFLDSPTQVLRSDYPRILANWSSRMDPARLHIGFYDHIVSHPDSFWVKVCDFLGISPIPLRNRSRANAAGDRKMPKEIEKELAMRYLDPTEEVASLFPGEPPTAWARSMREVLEGAGKA